MKPGTGLASNAPLTSAERSAFLERARSVMNGDSGAAADVPEMLIRALAEIDRMDKMLSRDYQEKFPVVLKEVGTTPPTPRGYDAVVTVVANDEGATRVRIQVRERGQSRRKIDLTGELAAYVWPLIRDAARRGPGT